MATRVSRPAVRPECVGVPAISAPWAAGTCATHRSPCRRTRRSPLGSCSGRPMSGSADQGSASAPRPRRTDASSACSSGDGCSRISSASCLRSTSTASDARLDSSAYCKRRLVRIGHHGPFLGLHRLQQAHSQGRNSFQLEGNGCRAQHPSMIADSPHQQHGQQPDTDPQRPETQHPAHGALVSQPGRSRFGIRLPVRNAATCTLVFSSPSSDGFGHGASYSFT